MAHFNLSSSLSNSLLCSTGLGSHLKSFAQNGGGFFLVPLKSRNDFNKMQFFSGRKIGVDYVPVGRPFKIGAQFYIARG